VASIANDPNGRRRILFVARTGIRKTIRLGKCDLKTAESVCRHVEALLASKIHGQPIARDTAMWLMEVSEKMRDRLAGVGLIEVERKVTVAEFLAKWLEDKRAGGYKPASLVAWGQVAAEITKLYGSKWMPAITHNDAEGYRNAMLVRKLRATTINKRLTHARQMFEDAVRFGIIKANPWKHIKQRQGDPSERRAYVPIADIERIIEYCPNVWWRLMVALARFAGLRTPSESFSLTWGDVDW
jgi:hypothetical protein